MKEKKEKMKNPKANDKKVEKQKGSKANKEKVKKSSKFIEIIKKKWLIKGTTTCLLVAIIIAVFIAIDIVMHNLELTPLDFSQDKLYTLTQESKDRVKDIDKDVHIYFVGSTDDDTNLALAKQYKNVNEKIVAEAVDINTRPDIAEKYEIESGTQGIIVECGEKSKVLSSDDLVTYDSNTYEPISIAEEKLTSSILNVTSDEIPKVYFLTGYSQFSLDVNMNYLSIYLQNEVNEIDTLNIISTGKVPEDCKTLVITTPNKDFDEITTNAIKEYINNGGNILWLNEAISQKQDLPNINSILELYAIQPFEVGMILETDTNRMVAGAPYAIFPNIEYSNLTKTLYDTDGVLFVNATKINIAEDRLEELNVEETDLLTTNETAFFRTDFTINTTDRQEGEETENFVLGAEFEKTLTEANEETGESAKTSKLVLIGENSFISDYPLSQTSQYPLVAEADNKDMVLNSIAYLVDREEDITARKTTGAVTYTPTEMQDTIILIIIFAVPALIIIAGIVIWQVRRRKK